MVLVEYSEHALSHQAGAEAISYVQTNLAGKRHSGVAISEDIVTASMNAILKSIAQAMQPKIVDAA